MKTTSINILNLCVPCYNHCKYCLLSWNGKCIGIEHARGVEYARNFYTWIKNNHPQFSLHSWRRIVRHKNFGRELVFSADLCYNGVNEKPLPLGEVAA